MSAAQWQSFEMRMRQRRATRLRLRAEVALEEGLIAEAEEALEEARTLDSSTPDLATLLAQIPLTAPAAVAPVVAPAPTVSRRFAMPIGLAALLLLVTALAVANHYASTPAAPAPAPVPEQAAAIPPVQIAPATAPGVEEPVATAGETNTAAAIAEAPPAPVEAPNPKRPEPRDTPIVMPDSAPLYRSPTHFALNPIEPLRPEPPSTPIAPPVRDGIEGALPIASDAPVTRGVAVPPPEAADETPSVRTVLAQYAAAYSSLDASAAQQVWPSVDSRALSRAFSGLESQRLSFGSCDVNVSGAGARADCQGTAEWTPKVGGGRHTERRRWSFDLQKADGTWQIVNATVR